VRWRRRKPTWEWPPELRIYSWFGPHLAVAFRIIDKRLRQEGLGLRRLSLPGHLYDQALMQLDPHIRYHDTKLADAGIENFMLRAVAVTRDG